MKQRYIYTTPVYLRCLTRFLSGKPPTPCRLYLGIHAATSIVGADAVGELLAQGEAPTCALSLQGLAAANQVLLSTAVQQAASN